MISVNNLSVHFTGTDLFSNVTFNISDHERIGLVGMNGSGKSTLLKILCGAQEAESGTVVVASGQTVGYLPQEMLPDAVGTVIEETMTAFRQIDVIEAELERTTNEIAQRDDYHTAEYMRLLEHHNDLSERLNILGGNKRREAAEKILLGLGFKHEEFERRVAEFSGGWQMRVELAKLLLKHPDFLLLDEPTNHLDIESIIWLENYLTTYSGAVVLVSHDRTFLDNITKRTIEITAGRIYDYRCSYSDYVVQMQERRASQMAQLTSQQRQIAQIEAFIERFRYKATKSKQVQSRVKMLEKMEMIEVDEVSSESIHFRFPPAPHSGKIVVETKGLGKKYGEHVVFDGVDMLVTSGQKIAFVGRNGEGKSTMAKIIVGEIADYEGSFRLGQGVVLGYYAQNQAAMLDLNKTVFETIDDVAQGDIRPKIRNILGSFLFSNEDIDKKVRVLSGGEKARLALAKLLLTPSNLLILDEPTNHLDMNSKDVLKNALLQYSGTLIVVSHDRDFLQGLSEDLFEFRNGGVHEFKGDMTEFVEWRRKSVAEEEAMSDAKARTTVRQEASEGKRAYERSKEEERERRRLQNIVDKKEKEIEQAEEILQQMEKELSDKPQQEHSFFERYNKLKENLAVLMNEWEEAVIAVEERV
ncbi:MAG: ABC-F family ATP-binding cassette domain-containing protein [Bacteroidales bacterium]|nr:ABC-F family ATP-binding cassette domain-containing protein [Bacteroidales bacterium]MBR1799842.1 ABC-F family ATP-binding cassette domain-containing protein [Bacteroidales bacterium]